MSTISMFLGITITMFYNEHPPSHFHAEYGEYEATYDIETLTVVRGELPRRSHRYILTWATQHQDELRENWNRMRQNSAPLRIDPLV
jgi:hypothetical protein